MQDVLEGRGPSFPPSTFRTFRLCGLKATGTLPAFRGTGWSLSASVPTRAGLSAWPTIFQLVHLVFDRPAANLFSGFAFDHNHLRQRLTRDDRLKRVAFYLPERSQCDAG